MEMPPKHGGHRVAADEGAGGQDLRFQRKEEWKNHPGNRYTPGQLGAPARSGEWVLSEPEEKFLWPCP